MVGHPQLAANIQTLAQGLDNWLFSNPRTLRLQLKNYIGLVLLALLAGLAFLLVAYSSPLQSNHDPAGFLSQEEKQWIKQLQEPLKVGVTAIPNQVLVSGNGEYRGFSIDLFHKIEDELGVELEFVYFGTWGQLIDAAKDRRIDIVFLAQKTPSRLSYMEFTDTVLAQQNKIIVNTRNKRNVIAGDMSGWRLAVTKGSAIHEYLKSHYADATLVPVETEGDALALLSSQSVDAAISEAVRASHYIKTHNLKNLRIAGNLDYDYHLSIGSRSDLPILSVILSKAVTHILSDQIAELKLKWGYANNEVLIFDKQTLIYLALAFGIILPFSSYLYFTNKRLQRETAARKQVIEDLQAANEMIHDLKLVAEQEARTDELTQISNKRRINELLAKQIAEYKRTQVTFSVGLVDLDHFKQVNDQMGHEVGDKVLEIFAKNSLRCLRPYDYFGRVGGEEFAIILPNTAIGNAVGIAERIRVTAEQYSYQLDGYEFNVTLSAGVAEVTGSDTATSIMQRADKLLYQSKSDGRNKVSV